METCLFCKLVAGDIASDKVYEDEEILAFKDISPKAPTHILLIPKVHIATLNDLQEGHAELIGKLFLTAKRLAKEQGFDSAGYRTVINCNRLAGQSVFHVHVHLLAGRLMGWPPG